METERLYLRKIVRSDYEEIAVMLQDIDVMYAWEHAFSDAEVTEWIDENLERYDRDGFSYWAVIEKESQKLIGVCGILAENSEGEPHIGIGYIYRKDFWGRGYAFESASACVNYAFETLRLQEITAQIRPENAPSRKVAEKLGMTVAKEFVKQYKGKDMVHLLYRLPVTSSSE